MAKHYISRFFVFQHYGLALFQSFGVKVVLQRTTFSIISNLFLPKPRSFQFSSRMAIGHIIAVTYSLNPKLCQPRQGHFTSSTDIKKRKIYLVIVE